MPQANSIMRSASATEKPVSSMSILGSMTCCSARPSNLSSKCERSEDRLSQTLRALDWACDRPSLIVGTLASPINLLASSRPWPA